MLNAMEPRIRDDRGKACKPKDGETGEYFLTAEESRGLLCEREPEALTALPGWLKDVPLLPSLTLSRLFSLTSVEGLSGCAALHTLTLDSLYKLTSVEGLSGCVALHTLKLDYLDKLTSVEVLSGCAALGTLEFKEHMYAKMDKLTSMPDLSGLAGLKVVKYDECQDRLKALLEAWEQGGRHSCQ